MTAEESVCRGNAKPPDQGRPQPDLQVPEELLDQLVKGPMSQDELESMFRSLKKAVIERAMGAEMSEHLGYRQGESKPEGQTNQRNGASGKTVITDEGPVRIDVPRDRQGSFEPHAHPQARAALHRLRPEDHRHVCPRHDGARDPGLSGRDVRHGGVAGLHQQGHR